MAEKKHIQHLKSATLSGGTAKLPQASDLLYGEIAINYKKGYETISMKNDENEIVTFNPKKITVDSALSTTSENPVQNKAITDALDDKQDELVSGTNIKTINGTSLLGSGDITIGGGVTVDSALSDTSVNPVQNKVITNALAFKKVTNPSDSSKVGIVNSLSEYYDTNIGKGAVIEGDGSAIVKITASGQSSHAEGGATTANASYSHAEGGSTTASGIGSHAEGGSTTASGNYSHAEGYQTTASNQTSHAEGNFTTASGADSHAEGQNTTASGSVSHAEGYQTTASSYASHAEGSNTTASGLYSHAEGLDTVTNNQSEHASGRYNVSSSASTTFGDSDNTLFSVGNGTSTSNRHNAFEIRQNGDIYITKDDTDVQLQEVLNDLESGKVDKVTGKGLSTNDFDDEYMEALDHINIDSNNTLEINNDSSNDIKLSTDGYIFIGDNYTNKVNIDAGSGPVNISSYQDNIELTARYNGSIKFTVEYGSDAIVLSVGGTELTLNQANLQKLINLLQNS